ncbi:MAG: hypothetical protein KTR29_08400 [Rhodothermaceae bacterium]|nr:hypothetical protein [Rhodothermaceae bacterium]
MPMSNNRLYTEKEISTILKRAGERQAEQGQKETQGLSLAEIQQIAGEVGLDPRIVASVAAELETTLGKEKGQSWLGLPVRAETERVLPGAVSVEQWPEVVSAIENAMGVIGASGQVGKMLEWTYTSKLVQYKVSLTPVNGQTKVRVHGNFTRLARAALLPFLLFFTLQGTVIPIGAGLPFWAGGAIGLTLGILVYFLVQFGFTSYIRGKERTFEQMITRLGSKVPLSTVSSAGLEEGGTSTAQIEIPEEGEEQQAGALRSRNRVS